MKPLAIDLYCGLGGWTEGLLAEGYRVVGYDIERHEYGEHRYPAQLVLQDVTTLHGRQFRDASLIVASPPCQAYSYRAMPWKRAKALPPPDNTLFESCFRIQREASEAAGRHIPLVVENVRGAQKWVGRAEWHFGSYYLWGDVPLLMPSPSKCAMKFNPDGTAHPPGSWFAVSDSKNRGAQSDGTKLPGNNSPRMWRERDIQRLGDALKGGDSSEQLWKNRPPGHFDGSYGLKGIPHRPSGQWTNPAENGTKVPGLANGHFPPGGLAQGAIDRMSDGVKQGGEWWHDSNSMTRRTAGGSKARKAASAMIAKIPFALARYIAEFYRPKNGKVTV